MDQSKSWIGGTLDGPSNGFTSLSGNATSGRGKIQQVNKKETLGWEVWKTISRTWWKHPGLHHQHEIPQGMHFHGRIPARSAPTSSPGSGGIGEQGLYISNAFLRATNRIPARFVGAAGGEEVWDTCDPSRVFSQWQNGRAGLASW